VLDSATQFSPAAPIAFDSAKSSRFMAQAREVYQINRSLTPEQREIAGFWDCNPYTMHVQGHTMFATKKISPGGHWISIVGEVSRQRQDQMLAAAEAYAVTAIAISDAFLSVWTEKFRSGVVRPETVINRYIDPNWQPLLQTPPFPEYTSGHSGISSAAAVVLTGLFGDSVQFSDSTEKQFGLPTRSYRSFRQAADEASLSRLYGGIHYRQAIEQGQVQGRGVGALVNARVLTRTTSRVAEARTR
jgi:hypothetical protein